MDMQKLSTDDFWDRMYTAENERYSLQNDRATYNHSQHLDTVFVFDQDRKNAIAFTFAADTFCLNEPEIFIGALLTILKDRKYRSAHALTLLMQAIKSHYGKDLWSVTHWRVDNGVFVSGTARPLA